MTLTIKIDLAKKCAECGKGGATDNGLCLDCTTKAITRKKMKSAQGAAVAARFDAMRRGAKLLLLIILLASTPPPCPPPSECSGPPETRNPRCAACYDDL